ncbi:hypothetical protein L596_022075 [Steinernema carpocapsae]|uniref:Uncharacterized protein n=1 Tax=Steinernema carpocapsae TaxID=34508 RepID=A0A4U5MKR0_STECR|nr:hypothetical protein L596_022075 [Steinernema carpocapsae]
MRNPQTAQKSSYPARVAEVVAGLIKAALLEVWQSSATALFIQMVTLAGLVAGVCLNSSLSPCCPAISRRQPRSLIAVAHEFERSITC